MNYKATAVLLTEPWVVASLRVTFLRLAKTHIRSQPLQMVSVMLRQPVKVLLTQGQKSVIALVKIYVFE